MSVPKVWYIPHQRNPFFTGREAELTQLHLALQTEGKCQNSEHDRESLLKVGSQVQIEQRMGGK